MALERLLSSATPAEVAARIDRDGYAIVERAVAPAVLDRTRAELQPHLDATPLGPDDFAGRRTRRTGGLVARSATCRDIIMNPVVLGAVGKVLGHATSFQLHLTQVIAIGPGEPGQTIHRDQWAFDFFPFPQGYDVQCNTIWAMTDFTDANGAARIVPGSHRFGDRRQFTYDQTEPAEMPAGSVLFYTGALYHGAGANRSDRVRYGLNVTYSVSWLRQEENQYLSVPADVARTLPDELLRLMGYARGAYALGYVDDLRDPLDALRGVGISMRRPRGSASVRADAQAVLRGNLASPPVPASARRDSAGAGGGRFARHRHPYCWRGDSRSSPLPSAVRSGRLP